MQWDWLYIAWVGQKVKVIFDHLLKMFVTKDFSIVTHLREIHSIEPIDDA